MIAPAYTMIWTANRNGAPSIRKKTAIVKKFTMRNSAEWTALRMTASRRADATEMGAKTQNTMLSSGTYRPSSSIGVGAERRAAAPAAAPSSTRPPRAMVNASSK